MAYLRYATQVGWLFVGLAAILSSSLMLLASGSSRSKRKDHDYRRSLDGAHVIYLQYSCGKTDFALVLLAYYLIAVVRMPLSSVAVRITLFATVAMVRRKAVADATGRRRWAFSPSRG